MVAATKPKPQPPTKTYVVHTCQNCGAEATCTPQNGRNTYPLGWGTAELHWYDDQGYVAAGRRVKLCTGCMERYRKAFRDCEAQR